MSTQLLKPRSLYRIFVVLLLLCIGLYFVPFSIMGSNLEFIPGDTGDAALCNYFLEHGFQWLSGNQKSFWNAPFFYPEPNVITFSENFLGTLPIYSVFRFSGFDRETSFQLWIIAIFILNYISCVWVLRRFSISLIGSAAGAFVFTFSLPVIARLGHIQLLPRFMVPFAFYFIWKYLRKPDLKLLTGLCLSIVWQFYCTIYIGFFLILALTAFVLSCAIISAKDYRWWEILWGSLSKFAYRAGIILASALILLPLFIPYYYTSLAYGLREWSQISDSLPRIQKLIIPAYGSLLWNWLKPLIKNLAWGDFFIGVIPWLAVAFALFDMGRKNRNPISEIGRAAALAIVLIFLMVIDWNGFSFYKYISLMPGAKAIRVVTRIILVLSFFFAISVGVLFTRLDDWRDKGGSAVLLSVFSFLLLCALVTDQYVHPRFVSRYSKSDSQSRSQEIADEVLKKNPSAKVFAYMPPKDIYPTYTVHTYAMLASQNLNIPTINGYSGSIPRNYDFYLNYDKPWALQQWITFTTAKYDTFYKSAGKLFDGLVIVGSDDENIESRSVSIAHEALPNEGFKAEISPASEEIRVKVHDSAMLPVKITNKSGLTWPALGDFDGTKKISLSYRWLSLNEEQIEGYTPRFPLHYDLLPGESITLEIEIKAPSIPGIYIAEFDLVQEHVSWFANKGSKTARVVVRAGVSEDNIDTPSVSIAHEALPDEGFKAEISPASEEIRVKIDDEAMLPVKITNKSGLTWPALGDSDGTKKISLSYRWLSLNGEQIEGYTPRFPLHYDLLPGESITLEVEIKAPSIPGIYIAEFDLVQEHVSWFANKGSKTARIELTAE